ncbi:hypothetical protein [Natrinema sp. H-ect4]|uniref:hypothetical protein n=1 Tax=Natrinema sp. H-ect4 TaxID=3242699 RepID=UPI0035A940AE
MTGELGEIDVLARRERVTGGGTVIGGVSVPGQPSPFGISSVSIPGQSSLFSISSVSIPGQSSLSGIGGESLDGTTGRSWHTAPIEPTGVCRR